VGLPDIIASTWLVPMQPSAAAARLYWSSVHAPELTIINAIALDHSIVASCLGIDCSNSFVVEFAFEIDHLLLLFDSSIFDKADSTLVS
jgi:hypothetical protein